MATGTYNPDYSVAPGWVLSERLEVQGISQAEFARRCGRSPKLISEIVAGKAPVDPETALQFERVLGVDASIWLGIESAYRLHKAREAETEAAAASVEWAKAFPVRELVKRGCFLRPVSEADTVEKLLAFFQVASPEAWSGRYGLANVAYRHSPSFESHEAPLATWLRLGTLEAERQNCADYDESMFKAAVRQIRILTREPIEKALSPATTLCNRAGVALAPVPPLPRTALSGAARWLSPRKAIIQLNARHKSDDHLWFTFFHEAAHILLHSKREVFVDGANGGGTDQEVEANRWASDTLIPPRAWERFIASPPYSENTVRTFAEEQGIAPGIVVGRLQHQRLLPWRTRLNRLKVRLKWTTEA